MTLEFTSQSFCSCPETLITIMDPFHPTRVKSIQRIDAPPGHSCYYVSIRNACIIRAEREAWKRAQKEWHRAGPVPNLLISQHFSQLMDHYCAMAWSKARRKVPNGPGPERNRAFYAAFIAIAEERA